MHTKQALSVFNPVFSFQTRFRAVLPYADLLMRVYIGKIFFLAGLSKLRDWQITIDLFTDEYHVPLLSPEQIAALGLLALNFIAVIAYYSVLKDLPAALQDHLEWGLMLLLIACSHSTILHIDHYIHRQKPVV